MKAAPSTTSVEPTIGTATTHLAVDDDAASPWAMALVAVLAGHSRGLASDVGKQCLDVAPTGEVEGLLWPALLGKALARLAGQPLGERALDVEVAVPRVPGEFICGLNHGLIHPLVAGLHLLRGAHLGGRLVLVLMLLVRELMLVGLLGVLSMRQVLLHLL